MSIYLAASLSAGGTWRLGERRKCTEQIQYKQYAGRCGAADTAENQPPNCQGARAEGRGGKRGETRKEGGKGGRRTGNALCLRLRIS